MELMNFYEIEYWAVGYTKYPWVSGWRPLVSMPFFDALPPVSRNSKEDFWKVNPGLPGLFIDPGAKEWSDVLGCGGGPPSYFVSDKIVNDLSSAGIPILRATEMPIAEILSTALKNIPDPKYFVLEAEPGINYAYDLMGLDLDSNGKPIIDRTKRFPESIYRRSSWIGADLFGKRAFFDNTLALLCTEKVKELGKRNRWTNIEFKPVKVA